jgi:hypothetical protein
VSFTQNFHTDPNRTGDRRRGSSFSAAAARANPVLLFTLRLLGNLLEPRREPSSIFLRFAGGGATRRGDNVHRCPLRGAPRAWRRTKGARKVARYAAAPSCPCAGAGWLTRARRDRLLWGSGGLRESLVVPDTCGAGEGMKGHARRSNSVRSRRRRSNGTAKLLVPHRYFAAILTVYRRGFQPGYQQHRIVRLGAY